jgi:hypothetical protein
VPVPVLRTHTAAVITRLQALGVTVGDAQAPNMAPPYVVVYQIAGGDTYGPLGAQNDDAELIYQVTCVGTSREQAQWLVDKTLGLLSGISVSGRSLPLVTVEMVPGIQRDDKVSPPVFWATPRFRLFSTPS